MASKTARWVWMLCAVGLLAACGGTAPAPSAPRADVAPAPSPPPSSRRGPVEVIELSWRSQDGAEHRHMRAWRGGCFEMSGPGGDGQRVQTKRKGCMDAAWALKVFGQLDKLYKTAKLAADPGYWPYDKENLTMVGFPDAEGTLWIANDEATAAAMSRVVRQLIDRAQAMLRQQDLHSGEKPPEGAP